MRQAGYLKDICDSVFVLIFLLAALINFQHPVSYDLEMQLKDLIKVLFICFAFRFTIMPNENKKDILLNVLVAFFALAYIAAIACLVDKRGMSLENYSVYERVELYKIVCGVLIFCYSMTVDKIGIIIAGIIILFAVSVIWGLRQKYYLFDYYCSLSPEQFRNLNPEQFSSLSPEQFQRIFQGIFQRIASGRIFSKFVLPSVFAAVIAMILVFFSGIYFKSSRGKTNIFIFSVALITGILCIYYTKSVSAVLSFTIAFFITYLRELDKKKFLTITTIALSILIVIIYSRGAKNFYESSLRYYFSNYIAAFNMWRGENILTGVGFGKFTDYFIKYRASFGNDITYAHNYYLHILAENGIIGFIIFIGCLFYFIRKIFFIYCVPMSYRLIILFFLLNNFYGPDAHILSEIALFSLFFGLSLNGILHHEK